MKYEQIAGGYNKGELFENKGSCDLCQEKGCDILIDGKTMYGPWAWMCWTCWNVHGHGDLKLGTGRGQKYQRYEP